MKYDFMKCTLLNGISSDLWMIQSIAGMLADYRHLARDFNCIENVKNITSIDSTWHQQKRFASEYTNFTASSRVFN